nr:(Fe-S)-binding protein [Methanosarcina horonobensis]
MTNAMEIYQMLPKTNCKKCGKTSCMAFAVALMARELTPEDCPPLKEEPKYKESYEKNQRPLQAVGRSNRNRTYSA